MNISDESVGAILDTLQRFAKAMEPVVQKITIENGWRKVYIAALSSPATQGMSAADAVAFAKEAADALQEHTVEQTQQSIDLVRDMQERIKAP